MRKAYHATTAMQTKELEVSLVGRHQAFEFFKLVEDDVDLGLVGSLFLNHQEPLAVGMDVVMCATRSPPKTLVCENRKKKDFFTHVG